MVSCYSNNEVIIHNYTFMGGNQFWIAVYKVNGTGTFTKEYGQVHYYSKSNSTLTISYKKDLSELSLIKNLEISYESSAGGGALILNFERIPPSEKTFILKSRSIGGAIENKDERINVKIDLDGKIQVIELQNVQNSIEHLDRYGQTAFLGYLQ